MQAILSADVEGCADDEDSEGDGEEEQEDRGDDLGKRAGADILNGYYVMHRLIAVIVPALS